MQAPKVLAAYRMPSARVVSRCARTRTPNARVMPIAVVGTSSAASDSARRIAASRPGCSTSGASQPPTSASSSGRPQTSSVPVTATVASAAAKARAGRRTFCAQRAASTPPSAMPSMNAVRTSAPAQTVLPTTRPSARNHSTSNSSAAAPEAKNASGNLTDSLIPVLTCGVVSPEDFRMPRNLLAAVLLAGFACAVPAQDKVLRVVPHSNLNILDPVWTTQYMARNHGYMVYDTLFGPDEKTRIQPQMVEKWSESPDHRLWTFTLRSGLAFHDGSPVTGEDVAASIGRWGKRDAMGQNLMTFVERMDSPAPNTFRISLREACGFVLEPLGNPSPKVPFTMPTPVPAPPADKQIDDPTGSGPYIFPKAAFKPGDKAVYLRNPKYQPRKEPPSGTAGGKRVYVDRVEWNLALRDAQSQVNALAKGEIDILEQPAFESYAPLQADKSVQVVNSNPLGFQYMCRFNHLHPPFNNAKVRQAALAAFAQEPFLRAQVGVKEFYRSCPSMFTCGTPYGSPKGSEIQSKSNMKKAQELG